MRKTSLYIAIFLASIFVLGINFAQAQKQDAGDSNHKRYEASAAEFKSDARSVRLVRQAGFRPVLAGNTRIAETPVASQSSAKEISGYFEADDGGAYYIRQIGNNIYWFGENPNDTYANLLKGTISGNKITARFWDVPKGKAKGSGEITLEISGNGDQLVKLTSSVPFGARTFKKSVVRTEFVNGLPVVKGLPPEARSRPAGFLGGEGNLTAVWMGDDFAFYYVRELPGGDVVWVAEHGFYGGPGGTAQPGFTHVFFGKKIGQVIRGEWVDVPKGKSAGSGALELSISDPQAMESKARTGGFLAGKWWRSLPTAAT